jgi:pimeloyl-ACP methyl ester carboxylesterase
MNYSSQYITLGGYSHHYIDTGGDKPVILLLHGFASDLDVYIRVIPELAKTYRVLAIDSLGFGKTAKPTGETYSLTLYAKLMAEFIDKINVGKMMVVGHSMGGKIAMVLTVLYPHLVSKLVLVDTDGFFKVPFFMQLGSLKLMKPIIFKLIGSRSFIKQTLKSVYVNHALITEELIDRNVEMVADPATREAMVSMNANYYLNDLTRTGYRKRLSELKLPILIIWGDTDKFVATKYAAVANRELPNSQLVIIKHCGHVPQYEQPEAFLQALKSFDGASVSNNQVAFDRK